MNWRSTNRTPDARVTAFNRSGTMNQRGLGGGGINEYFKLLGSWLKSGIDYFFIDSVNVLNAQIKDTCVAAFDGIDDFAQINTSILFTVGVSVEMWVNINNVTTSRYLFGNTSITAGFRYSGANFLVFPGSGSVLRTVNYTKTNSVVKITVTKINTLDYNVFINDVLIGVTGTEVAADFAINIVGKRADGLWFNGTFQRFRILNGTTPILDYIFNHQVGTAIYDVSGNNNHGTISNIAPAFFWVKNNNGEPLFLNGCTLYTNDTTYLCINGNNNFTITGYTKISYFAAPFLVLKGLFNTILIPTDTELNAIIPAGTYGFAELDALTSSENLIINKTANSIISLTVKK